MSERFTLDVRMDMPKLLIDKNTNEKYNLLMVNDIERIVDLLNEQQDIIFKLQDLCGKSDGENAKLRIENKRLEEENEQLKQELAELLAVHTKIVETLDSEFVSKALEDGD